MLGDGVLGAWYLQHRAALRSEVAIYCWQMGRELGSPANRFAGDILQQIRVGGKCELMEHEVRGDSPETIRRIQKGLEHTLTAHNGGHSRRTMR